MHCNDVWHNLKAQEMVASVSQALTFYDMQSMKPHVGQLLPRRPTLTIEVKYG